MSGHSKWHNIQKTKGAADAKRSATFTKIAKEIIVAVKQGGSGDPANNSRLATVVAKAKAANMPNDNIKRTIDKALGAGNTDNYESVTYEGYGPCGVAVIVEALTDNRQRTAPEIRHYFDKFGKGMGAQGCVSWSFDRKGVIVIDNEDGELDEDAVMMDALDAGAEDFSPDGPVSTVKAEKLRPVLGKPGRDCSCCAVPSPTPPIWPFPCWYRALQPSMSWPTTASTPCCCRRDRRSGPTPSPPCSIPF